MRKIKKLVLSFSTINEFRLCPRRGAMLAIAGYNKIGAYSHPNLYIGKAGHKYLEQTYLGEQPNMAALAGEFGLPVDHQLEPLLRDYTSHYQLRKGGESQFECVAVEKEFILPLVENIFLRGHIDLVVKTRSEEYAILDHKFSSNPGRYVIPKIESSEQLSGYCYLASQALNLPINLVGFNGVALDPKVKGDDRFARSWTYRAQWQIDEYLANITYWARQIKAWLESEYVPTDCDHGRVAFNTTCPMTNFCDAPPEQRATKLLADYEKLDNPLNGVVEWES